MWTWRAVPIWQINDSVGLVGFQDGPGLVERQIFEQEEMLGRLEEVVLRTADRSTAQTLVGTSAGDSLNCDFVLPGVGHKDQLGRTAHYRVRTCGQLLIASQFRESCDDVAFTVRMASTLILHQVFNHGVRQSRASFQLLLQFRHLDCGEMRSWNKGSRPALSNRAERKQGQREQ